RGRQPDAVHTQPGQVVHALDHAIKITEAVAVGVPPRPDVELVEHGPVPPALRPAVLVHPSPDDWSQKPNGPAGPLAFAVCPAETGQREPGGMADSGGFPADRRGLRA